MLHALLQPQPAEGVAVAALIDRLNVGSHRPGAINIKPPRTQSDLKALDRRVGAWIPQLESQPGLQYAYERVDYVANQLRESASLRHGDGTAEDGELRVGRDAVSEVELMLQAPSEVALLARLRREVTALVPDSVTVQGILIQSRVPILRQMALGMQIALSTIPSLDRLFHRASAHVRCVGKNLSLVLIADEAGMVPLHATGHRLDASEVQALVGHRFHLVDWTSLTFKVLGWRNRTLFGAGDPLTEWQDVETIGLITDVVKRVEGFLGFRGPLLPSGGHGLLTNSL